MYIEAACKNPQGLRLQDGGERFNGILLNTMASF